MSKKPASVTKYAESVQWVSWRHIIPTFWLIICTCNSSVFDVVKPSMFHDATTKLVEVVCKLPPRKFTAADSQRPLPDPWVQYEKLTASAACETTPLPIPMCPIPYGWFAPLDVPFTEPLEPLDVRIINSSDFCRKSLTPWLSWSPFQVNQSPCHS